MSRVRQAVILAAGMGSRLRDVASHTPKGFLRLGIKSIIEESIAKLVWSGIDEIIIVTGFRNEHYEKLSKQMPFLKTVNNDMYETTGSMRSLSKAQDFLNGDFLLLESDLIYEFDALQVVQNTAHKNCVLLSGKTLSGDEVYADVRKETILKLSKKKAEIHHWGGELVGISRISHDLYEEMIAWEARKSKKYDYENCLSDLANIERINFEFVEDLAWCEVDDSRHLERAMNVVYPRVCERDAKISMYRRTDREVLLNPGPATTTDSVKYAMITEDICPREAEFGEMVEGIRRDLVRVVHGEGQYETVLFASSGTGAVEACLSSVIPPAKSVLIINNGAYGKRMEQICDAFGVLHIDYDIEWGQPINLAFLQSLLNDLSGQISHVALVHHETTVGILNPLRSIVEMANKANIQVIVDAMSSLGGIPIDLRTCKAHYLISSANKCLQGMPGVSFVVCERESLMETKEFAKRSFYFNLYDNFQFFQVQHQMQFTPPVHILYALRQAINEYFLEGETQRYQRYSESYECLIEGLEQLGLRLYVDKRHHSRLLTSVVEPDDKKYEFADMHQYLKKRGFTVYPGKSANKRMFRIANIGEITKRDVGAFLETLSGYLRARQINVGFGNRHYQTTIVGGKNETAHVS